MLWRGAGHELLAIGAKAVTSTFSGVHHDGDRERFWFRDRHREIFVRHIVRAKSSLDLRCEARVRVFSSSPARVALGTCRNC